MKIEAIEASRAVDDLKVVQLNAAEQARQLADARQTQILQNQGVSVTTPVSSVVENPRYSPSLYAQAAQFQLYNQSGVLATLAQQGHVGSEQPFHGETDEISAVDPAQGGTVNTLA